MPRLKRIDSSNAKFFSTRFCQLMDSHQPKLTQEEMGKILGVSKSSIGFYRDGTNQPNYSILIKIANYFNCSTDYLLGVSNYRGVDPQLRMICDYIGLSEPAVKDLRRLFTDQYCDELTKQKRQSIFSSLIEAVDFPDILDSVRGAFEDCCGIAIDYHNAPLVDLLSYEELLEEENSTRNSINSIDFQLYKITTYFRCMVENVIGIADLEHDLKERLKIIRNRISQLNSDEFMQKFAKGELYGVNKTQDN